MHQPHLLRRPGVTPTHRPPLLILLHGKGANEDDLFALAEHFDPRFLILSLRAPHEMAPGYYRWYERTEDAQGTSIFDEAEIETSRIYLRQALNDALMAFGADPHQVYLFGFSQGAAMAIAHALTAPQSIRGMVALAGRLLPSIAPLAAPASAMQHLTLLIQHGRADDIVPPEESAKAVGLFAELCVKQGARDYPAGHTITPGMLKDALDFLSVQLDHDIQNNA